MVSMPHICSLALGALLDIAQVQRSAADHFPSIIAAEAEVAVARGAQLAAQGGFDPSLVARGGVDPLGYYRNGTADVAIEQPTPLWGTSFFAGYRIGLGDFPDYKGGLATNDAGEVRGGLNLPFLRNGPIDRRRAAITRAELGLQSNEAARVQATIDVVRAASLRYFAWVGAGLRRQLAEQMLELARARSLQITARVRSGDAPDIERLDNERTIAQRESQVIAASRALEQAAIELSLYYRDASGEPVVAQPSALPPALAHPAHDGDDGEALIARALEARPDLRRADLAIRQAGVDVEVQRNQLWPALDLRLVASQDIGAGSPTRAPFELSAALVLDLPLLFRAQRGAVATASATSARFEAQRRLQRDRVVAEVRDGLSALRAARARIGAAVREAELAAEIARLERSRFGLGESTILIVNLRETAAIEAQVRVIDAQIDAHRALVDLKAITADLPSKT